MLYLIRLRPSVLDIFYVTLKFAILRQTLWALFMDTVYLHQVWEVITRRRITFNRRVTYSPLFLTEGGSRALPRIHYNGRDGKFRQWGDERIRGLIWARGKELFSKHFIQKKNKETNLNPNLNSNTRCESKGSQNQLFCFIGMFFSELCSLFEQSTFYLRFWKMKKILKNILLKCSNKILFQA